MKYKIQRPVHSRREHHTLGCVCMITGPYEDRKVEQALATHYPWNKMAVSPLIIPPASADRNGPASKSKLSASIVTSNGTSPNITSSSNGLGRDLAEQMNEEEKHKYVKGKANVFPHLPEPFLPESREETR